MIKYEELCSKQAIKLAEWGYELKHNYRCKEEKLKAIKLLKLANKYEQKYRKKHADIYEHNMEYEFVSLIEFGAELKSGDADE
jgi:tRNA A37 threonylcarbamoyladenosine biosynthesis protein TsaE